MNLPELSERDATGEQARIYAEIRRLGGVPMVALIFRHLATLPGGLEWMWEALGPAWRSGELQETAWRVAREAKLAPLAPMQKPDAIEEIRIVLASYNRANPQNLLSVLCILRLLDGHDATQSSSARDWNPPSVPGPLIPMGDIASLPPQVSALLDLVAAPASPGSPRIVQSLYRHFTHRPEFLALAIHRLRERFDDGSIDAEATDIHGAMSRAADDIVLSISAPPPPHPGIAPVCARFGGRVIPQMIVVGRLLDEALA